MRPLRILHTVESYHPSVGGMQEVVRQISERLAALGHQVTVATSKAAQRDFEELNGVRVVQFDVSGNAVRGYRGDADSYRNFLLHSDFDVIANFAAQQWATDLMLPLLDRIAARKVFVPTGFSGLYWPKYRDYFRNLPAAMQHYDMNVFLSDDYRDINFARENGITNTLLIPNGAGSDEFSAPRATDVRKLCGVPESDFLILLVGSHTGLKGHGAAARIFHRAKLQDATLLIVANDLGGGCARRCRVTQALFNEWQRFTGGTKKLVVRSLSREETVAAYQQADLFLFPSNIECSPIVLFECMASRTPFLSTDVGNAAEIAEWSGSGFIMPTRKTRRGFSKALVGPSARLLERVHGDAALRGALQASGYHAWQERFTWEKIAGDYETLYRDLVHAGRQADWHRCGKE